MEGTEQQAAKLTEKELKRTGVNCSLYLSKEAVAILDKASKASRRSRSVIVSLLVERGGPNILKDRRI